MSSASMGERRVGNQIKEGVLKKANFNEDLPSKGRDTS
jgi:hypothetical protein